MPPRVVLLRSGSEPDPYVRAFAAAGMEATCVPVLAFAFPHQEALRARLRRPEDYEGLICTSPRAVRALEEALAEGGVDAGAWRAKTAYAVGPKTAAALRALGFAPEGEESGSAEALAAVIANKKQLFLCGNRRRDTLPDALGEAGIPFDELVVYETRTRMDVALPEGREGDWLVFFSPSGVEAIESAPGADPSRYRKAAIGATTAAALEEHGWTAEAVADAPTPSALVRAIRRAAAGNR